MNTLETIRAFKMYRGRVQDRRLEDGDLHTIIDAARWAPSGHNSQPWEFLVVDERDTIGEIAAIATRNFDEFIAHGAHLMTWARNFHHWLRWSREELEARGDGIYFQRWTQQEWDELAGLTDEHAIRERMASMFGSKGESATHIRTAPCLIFTLLNTSRKVPDYSDELLALTSAGAAMQNIRLAAYELGIAVHEQSLLYDLPETRKAIGKLLGVPDHVRIVGGMRAGYRAGTARSSFTNVRRPVSALLHRNRF